MTWIRTIPLPEADEKLRRAIEAQAALWVLHAEFITASVSPFEQQTTS